MMRVMSMRAATPLRILHVNDRDAAAADSGGAEIYVARVAEAQRERGHDVHVHTADRVHTAALLDIWNPFARSALRRMVRHYDPDVVHVHNLMREHSASVLGVARNRATVMTLHDLRPFLGGEHERSLRGAVDSLVLQPLVRAQIRRHVACVIAVADAMRPVLESAGVANVKVVPETGRRPVSALRPPSDGHDVVYVGRLAEDKGVPVLLDAFVRVAAAVPEARLVVIGDGPCRRQVEVVAAAMPGRVDVHGRQGPDVVSQALSVARVAVVPSVPRLRREGLPLTAIDAVCHGRPLVTSDDPGAAEVARAAGGVVTPAEDAGALTDALVSLLTDPAAADAAGAAARASSQRYLPEMIAARLDDVYLALLESRDG